MEGNSRELILPPGLRFKPSDREALDYYLPRRINGQPFQSGLIHELNIYDYEPKNLPGFNSKESSFYFTPRAQKYPNGSRPSRLIKGGMGYWRITKKVEFKNKDGSCLGRKNCLAYFLNNGIRTNYLMHEYVLHKSLCPSTSSSQSDMLNEVVLCEVYYKGPSAKNQRESNSSGRGKEPEQQLVGWSCSRAGDEFEEQAKRLKSLGESNSSGQGEEPKQQLVGSSCSQARDECKQQTKRLKESHNC